MSKYFINHNFGLRVEDIAFDLIILCGNFGEDGPIVFSGDGLNGFGFFDDVFGVIGLVVVVGVEYFFIFCKRHSGLRRVETESVGGFIGLCFDTTIRCDWFILGLPKFNLQVGIHYF